MSHVQSLPPCSFQIQVYSAFLPLNTQAEKLTKTERIML